MRYTLKPGSIACMLHITPEGGAEQNCIFAAEGKQPRIFINGRQDNDAQELAAFMALPLSVRAAANRHFGTVFALPVERRSNYLKSCVPWEVEA